VRRRVPTPILSERATALQAAAYAAYADPALASRGGADTLLSEAFKTIPGWSRTHRVCPRAAILVAPDVREWLPEGSPGVVRDRRGRRDGHDAVHAAWRSDGHGRAAYEPVMMIALLLLSTWPLRKQPLNRRSR
jgi:hypothetical protein